MNRFERRLQARKRRQWWLWGLLCLLCAGAGVGTAWLLTPAGKGRYRRRPFDYLKTIGVVVRDPYLIFNGRSRVNIVFLGCDRDYDNRARVLDTPGRADTILIIGLQRNPPEVSLVSIPRDTLVRIPGHGSGKINAAHSYGGPQLMVTTLRESVGIYVDHYVVFKFDGFKKAVDAVGGVDVEVPKDMEYHDNWANLHISLKKGWQHLDGEKAHGFVRFRHDRMGDLGRIERQHMLAKALAKKMLLPSMVFRLPTLIPTLRECVDTDMSDEQLASVAVFMRQVKVDSLQTAVLPGTWVAPFLILHRSKSEELLANAFGDTFDRTAWEINITALSSVRSPRTSKKKPKRSSPPPEPLEDDTPPPEETSFPEFDISPGSPERLPPPPGDAGIQPFPPGSQSPSTSRRPSSSDRKEEQTGMTG